VAREGVGFEACIQFVRKCSFGRRIDRMCLVHGGVATTGRDAIDDGAISLPWGGLVG
jgi:hypothetical protein